MDITIADQKDSIKLIKNSRGFSYEIKIYGSNKEEFENKLKTIQDVINTHIKSQEVKEDAIQKESK